MKFAYYALYMQTLHVNDSPKIIGSKLRSARKKLQLSIVDIELQTNINRGQISRFENGYFVQNSHNLQKILNFYGISSSLEASNPSLAERVAAISERSPTHAQMITTFVSLLEQVDI